MMATTSRVITLSLVDRDAAIVGAATIANDGFSGKYGTNSNDLVGMVLVKR